MKSKIITHTNEQKYICPARLSGGLDNPVRRFLQNPQKILQPFIKEGMTVLDVGCGPGFFTVEIAKLLNGSGKVIAADIQDSMLDIIRRKIQGTTLEQRIELHKSDYESIGVTEKVDFVLAFWMVHEVRKPKKFFEDLTSILKPDGSILIIEPKLHVTKRDFGAMVDLVKELGFTITESPKAFFSRAIVLTKEQEFQINPIELGRQLKKPTGEIGIIVAENMNVANEQLYDFVLSQITFNDNAGILEIGCGNGKFVSKLFDANSDIHLTVVDYSDVMCNETMVVNKSYINDNKLVVRCEDAIAMSFPDESFDMVVTLNTVYFWVQLEQQLNEIKRVLKKDGLLIIGYRPKSVMKDFPSTQEVFNLYEPEDLQLLLKQNGFEIIKEVRQTANRTAVDGSQVQSIDICLIAK
jgi:ubiquinone/menaquinone biosynthesis C-methylase UbiE